MKQRQRNSKTGRDEVVDVKENYDKWLKRQQETHGVDTVDTFIKKTKNLSSDRKQYQNYIKVIGKENMPSSLSKFQDLKYNDVSKWGLLKDYKKSRSSNMISAFTSFEQYVEYKKRIENEIIGLTTSNGLKVKSQSKHFIERVFGTNEDPNTKKPRSGVSLKNIKDALTHGKESIDKKDETVLRYTSNNCCVTLNKNTGTLIQVNPISRKRVRK